MNFSIIQKSQLEGATRIDPEYYQPEYLDMFEKIKKFEINKANDACDILRGNTPKEYGDHEILIVRSGDLSYGFINDDENLLKAKNKNIFFLKNNDILISSIGLGSIGKINIFTDENNKLGTVSEVSVLRNCKNNPYFMWAFLAGKFGQFQINREITGATGQLHLNTGNIENIIIPKISNAIEKDIENLYKEAENLYKNSKNYYKKAEYYLLEELNLKDYEKIESLSAVVNLSEVENSRRMDAEYFQEKYKIVLEKIRKNKAKKLGDLVSVKKGIEVGAEEYQEEGNIFIRVSSMTKFGIVESDQKYLSEKLYEKLKKDFEPKKGEILLTKDATPGIAYVLKHDIQGIISGGTLRLKLKDNEVEGEYLALCLNSFLGQMQAERDAGGSVIAHWKPEQIKNVLIPILPKEIQEKISNLVKQSFEARKKSKELLEEAKRKVEEMIEK